MRQNAQHRHDAKQGLRFPLPLLPPKVRPSSKIVPLMVGAGRSLRTICATLRCSPSELPGYEAQVTKAIASWPRSLLTSCLRSSGGRRQEGVAPWLNKTPQRTN